MTKNTIFHDFSPKSLSLYLGKVRSAEVLVCIFGKRARRSTRIDVNGSMSSPISKVIRVQTWLIRKMTNFWVFLKKFRWITFDRSDFKNSGLDILNQREKLNKSSSNSALPDTPLKNTRAPKRAHQMGENLGRDFPPDDMEKGENFQHFSIGYRWCWIRFRRLFGYFFATDYHLRGRGWGCP